jgi:hypothetical protein
MPWHIRAIGRYGNAILLGLSGLFALALFSKGQHGMAFFAVAICALGGEAWLEAELRKAALRRRLAEESRVDVGARPTITVDARPSRPTPSAGNGENGKQSSA